MQFLLNGDMGVDLFFALSGFLIMHLLLRGLERDRMRCWVFLWNRWLRLVPACVCIILTPIYPYTHTLTHSYTHTPVHPYTHTPIHPCTHTPIRSYTHTPIHPYTPLQVCSLHCPADRN
jgi:hypothetical protein